MSEDNWIELEYTSLRAEILARDESERSTVRFFLPAAAAVYTIPYFLAEQHSVLGAGAAVFLWTFCAAVAGLLVLVMILNIYWTADGTRKIGTYIKECLEPRTDGGLRWEGVIFHIGTGTRLLPNETTALCVGVVLGNLLAAAGASFTFLAGPWQYAPLLMAVLLAALSVPSLWKLSRASEQRRRHAEIIRSYIEREFKVG